MDVTAHRPAVSGSARAGWRRRWTPRIIVALAVMIGFTVAVGAGLWVATPSVGNAERRAHTLAASHGARDDGATVPGRFAAALVATEDSRFYHHHGIDLYGVGRALVGAVRSEGDQGGSTLDQQLAKALYTNGQRRTRDQVVQVTLAVKLDTTYSKAQILEMYAQSIYYGDRLYGLHAAACGYFDRPPAALSWAQASLLAGLPQAPSSYDPLTHPQLAHQRQGHVLDRLVAAGALTRAQADQIGGQSWHLAIDGSADRCAQ